jgi:hypothetical protein
MFSFLRCAVVSLLLLSLQLIMLGDETKPTVIKPELVAADAGYLRSLLAKVARLSGPEA